MIIKCRITNIKDEYVSSLVPLNFSSNIAESICHEINIDDLDYAWLKKTIFKDLEILLSSTSIIEFKIKWYTETDEHFYVIEIDNSKIKGLVNSKITVDNEYLEAITYITDNLVNEYSDIYLRVKSSSALGKAVSEMKEALGMKSTDLTGCSDLDELCEKISNETKAEIVKPKETLTDYVCNDLLRQELEEIKDFFENAKVYKEANIDIPKGILFKGPWGTGKTYAARCIAGSVDCYFMTCTASALQGMYIGSGAENIRNIFKGAKLLAEKSKKGVIIFIDELDSFGNRESHSGGASGEEDRTLNQLLAEMSGFTDDTDILVLAATNFAERLDSALMRSGRFGRQITIDYPDDIERTKLIEYYFGKIKLPLQSSVSYEDISALTQGLTPADIKEIANESGILTIRIKGTEITLDTINEAINKVITKNIRHPDKDTETLDLVTAHECGHVLAEIYYNKTIPVKVTNYAYGDTGGFTQSGDKLSGIIPKQRFINEIKILLGGRAAEEVVCGYITNGASNDLEKAKNLMKAYFKYYNFENYKVSELDQIILDRISEIYTEVLEDFHKPEIYTTLTNLICELTKTRVLYTSDIAIITNKFLKGEIL